MCSIVLLKYCIFYKLKACGNCVVRWWLAFFSNKVFLIKICISFFRHNIIAHLIQYSINTTFIYTGKPTNLCDLLYLQCSLCCGGLEQNLQYLWCRPAESPLSIKGVDSRTPPMNTKNSRCSSLLYKMV